MITPQAQSKINEVYDFMMSFEGMINPNNIRFSRWLRDAKALRKSNPAEGFLMEALVYRAQGKLDQAVEYAKKSYQLDKTVAGNNYATILSDAGYFKDASKLALKNLQEDNFNTYAFTKLIVDSSMTLDKEVLLQSLSLFKDPDNKSESLLQLGHSTLEIVNNRLFTLNQLEISIDTFIRVCSIAVRSLNSFYLGTSQVRTTVQNNEVGTFLIIDEYIPNIDADDCFMIHDKYTDDLIDSELSFKDYKRIVYNFLPLEDDDLSNDDLHTQQGISV